MDKGLIIRYDGTFDLEMWADADFAGTRVQELSGNAKAAKSRRGCVVTLGGVSLAWKMQLISEICLSTTHMERTGLSNSL